MSMPGDAQVAGESLLSGQFRRAVDPSHALADGTSFRHWFRPRLSDVASRGDASRRPLPILALEVEDDLEQR